MEQFLRLVNATLGDELSSIVFGIPRWEPCPSARHTYGPSRNVGPHQGKQVFIVDLPIKNGDFP